MSTQQQTEFHTVSVELLRLSIQAFRYADYPP